MYIRIILLLILFSIFFSYNIFNFSKIIESSKENISLAFLLIVVTVVLTVLVIEILKLISKRRLLIRFTKKWKEFSGFWILFHMKIDSSLIHNKELVFEDLDEETKNFKKYHILRKDIRELIFLIGEENLLVKNIPDWEKLIKEEEYLKDNEYKTLFSFMVEFNNPIYAVNKFGKPLWDALHISSDFMEYLTYRHQFLKKYWKILE